MWMRIFCLNSNIILCRFGNFYKTKLLKSIKPRRLFSWKKKENVGNASYIVSICQGSTDNVYSFSWKCWGQCTCNTVDYPCGTCPILKNPIGLTGNVRVLIIDSPKSRARATRYSLPGVFVTAESERGVTNAVQYLSGRMYRKTPHHHSRAPLPVLVRKIGRKSCKLTDISKT